MSTGPSRRLRRAVAPPAGTRLACVMLSLAGALPGHVAAQTTFAWPSRPVEYARYITPEQCVALADRLVASAWGAAGAVRDTFPDNPEDTLPASVVQSVRTCAATFRPDAVTPFELPWLLRLYLLAGRDDEARRVAEREVSLARTPDARAAALTAASGEFLDARPARLLDAVSYAARADSTASVVDQVLRAKPHWRLGLYALSVLDTVLLSKQLDALRAVHAPVSDVALMLSMSLRMLRQSHPDEREALREALVEPAKMDRSATSEAAKQLLDEVVPAGRPHVAADYWFTAAQGDTVRPRAGRISLLVFVGERCAGDPFGGDQANRCAPQYAVLRRLHQRFGNALDITLMARTEGFFRSYPPPNPRDEAELLRQYFLEDVALPGALAVVTTPFTRLPDPDGRRRNRPTPNLQFFHQRETDGGDDLAAEAVLVTGLVGFDGAIKFVTTCEPRNERFLVAVIAKLVGNSPQTTRPTTGALTAPSPP